MPCHTSETSVKIWKMIPTNRWLLATAFVALVACTAAELAEPHHGDADRNDATLRRELESVTEVRPISVHHGIPPNCTGHGLHPPGDSFSIDFSLAKLRK